MINKAKGVRQPARTDASSALPSRGKKLQRGILKIVKFFFSFFYPPDNCFDIDRDAVLCSVFSLINISALRCAAAEQ